MSIADTIRDHSLHADLLKAAPPVSVGTLTLMGYNLSDFALVITIIYTSCLLFVLIRDKFVGYYHRTNGKPYTDES
jgi:hypothetical protein